MTPFIITGCAFFGIFFGIIALKLIFIKLAFLGIDNSLPN